MRFKFISLATVLLTTTSLCFAMDGPSEEDADLTATPPLKGTTKPSGGEKTPQPPSLFDTLGDTLKRLLEEDFQTENPKGFPIINNYFKKKYITLSNYVKDNHSTNNRTQPPKYVSTEDPLGLCPKILSVLREMFETFPERIPVFDRSVSITEPREDIAQKESMIFSRLFLEALRLNREKGISLVLDPETIESIALRYSDHHLIAPEENKYLQESIWYLIRCANRSVEGCDRLRFHLMDREGCQIFFNLLTPLLVKNDPEALALFPKVGVQAPNTVELLPGYIETLEGNGENPEHLRCLKRVLADFRENKQDYERQVQDEEHKAEHDDIMALEKNDSFVRFLLRAAEYGNPYSQKALEALRAVKNPEAGSLEALAQEVDQAQQRMREEKEKQKQEQERYNKVNKLLWEALQEDDHGRGGKGFHVFADSFGDAFLGDESPLYSERLSNILMLTFKHLPKSIVHFGNSLHGLPRETTQQQCLVTHFQKIFLDALRVNRERGINPEGPEIYKILSKHFFEFYLQDFRKNPQEKKYLQGAIWYSMQSVESLEKVDQDTFQILITLLESFKGQGSCQILSSFLYPDLGKNPRARALFNLVLLKSPKFFAYTEERFRELDSHFQKLDSNEEPPREFVQLIGPFSDFIDNKSDYKRKLKESEDNEAYKRMEDLAAEGHLHDARGILRERAGSGCLKAIAKLEELRSVKNPHKDSFAALVQKGDREISAFQAQQAEKNAQKHREDFKKEFKEKNSNPKFNPTQAQLQKSAEDLWSLAPLKDKNDLKDVKKVKSSAGYQKPHQKFVKAIDRLGQTYYELEQSKKASEVKGGAGSLPQTPQKATTRPVDKKEEKPALQPEKSGKRKRKKNPTPSVPENAKTTQKNAEETQNQSQEPMSPGSPLEDAVPSGEQPTKETPKETASPPPAQESEKSKGKREQVTPSSEQEEENPYLEGPRRAAQRDAQKAGGSLPLPTTPSGKKAPENAPAPKDKETTKKRDKKTDSEGAQDKKKPSKTLPLGRALQKGIEGIQKGVEGLKQGVEGLKQGAGERAIHSYLHRKTFSAGLGSTSHKSLGGPETSRERGVSRGSEDTVSLEEKPRKSRSGSISEASGETSSEGRKKSRSRRGSVTTKGKRNSLTLKTEELLKGLERAQQIVKNKQVLSQPGLKFFCATLPGYTEKDFFDDLEILEKEGIVTKKDKNNKWRVREILHPENKFGTHTGHDKNGEAPFAKGHFKTKAEKFRTSLLMNYNILSDNK